MCIAALLSKNPDDGCLIFISPSHVISLVTWAKDLHSGEAEDLDIVFCFLEFHKINVSPKKMQKHSTNHSTELSIITPKFGMWKMNVTLVINESLTILIWHKNLQGFNCKIISRRACIMVDFWKTFDTLRWGAINLTMEMFAFDELFHEMVMSCVKTTSFSVPVKDHRWDYSNQRQG